MDSGEAARKAPGRVPAVLEPITAVMFAIVIGEVVAGLGIAGALTPLRFILSLAATTFGVGTALFAIRGLGRGQLWALRYVQLVVGIQLGIGLLLAFGVHPFFFRLPEPIGLLGAFAAAAALPAVLGEEMTDWAWRADGLRPYVAGAIAVAAVVATAGPVAATSISDPTQVPSDALTVRATAQCRTGAATVTIDVTWSRTDLWPGGPFGHMSDRITVLMDELPPGAPQPNGTVAADFSWTVADRSPVNSASPAVYTAGQAQDFTPGAWAALGEGFDLVIGHEALQAGHEYHVVGTSPTNMPSQFPRRAVIEYQHGDRFTQIVEIGCRS